MPSWLKREKAINACDFCGYEIPHDAKICPKCKKEQVEAIIRERKSAETYDGDEEPLPQKISLKDSLKFCSKIVLISLAIALPFDLIHEALIPMVLGLGLIFLAAIVGGAYMPIRGEGLRKSLSDSPPDPTWAIIGGVGLLLFFFGVFFEAIFYKIL